MTNTGPGTETAVELVSVTKVYGDVRAVDEVNLRVRKGEFFTLLGPSGCGKTTTLRIIGGFESLTSGRVVINGRDSSDDPPFARDTSLVFQDYALFPHMTVAENVAFGLRMRRVAKAERQRRVAEGLEQVNLGEVAGRKPAQLSGGQRQRVALARSLVIRPSVLLLDEPLGALDAKIRRQMQMELKALQSRIGLTFIYVTHDQEEAMIMSDNVAIMRAGRLEQVGRPGDMYSRPRSRFVASFLGQSNLLPVRVARIAAGFVELEHASLGWFACPYPEDVAVGQGTGGYLVLRPERMRLKPAGVERGGSLVQVEASAGGRAIPATNAIRGRVSQVVYVGPVTRYTVEVGAEQLLVETPGYGTLGRGDGVAVEWSSSDGWLVMS